MCIRDRLYSIDALHSAINAGRMVRFRYKDDGTRTVSPWQLAWENGCYYLIAYQDEKEPAGIRNYRVDRMSSVTVLGLSLIHILPGCAAPKQTTPSA